MNVLLVTFEGGGNVPPFVELARTLCRRGDTVTVLAQASLRPRFADTGATFKAAARGVPYDPHARIGLEQQYALFGRIFFDDGYGEDLVAEARGGDFDVAVVDCHLYGAIAAAATTGIPLVVLVHTLFAFFHGVARTHLDAVLGARARWGLPPIDADRLWSDAETLLVTSFAALDETQDVATTVEHVGPLFPDPESAVAGPADLLVALSTTYMAHDGLLERIAEALGTLPLTATMTAGDETDRAIRLPPNVSMHAGWTPHAPLTRSARAVICHGGHGIVSTALACGRPVLCLPLGRDQPYVAERVARAGAGIQLDGNATASEIRTAVTRLLDDPSFAVCAADFATTSTAAADRAAALVERAASRGRRA